MILAIALIIVATLIYFLPTIIASHRNLLNAGSILIVNLFLCGTLIGWVGTLAWLLLGAYAEDK